MHAVVLSSPMSPIGITSPSNRHSIIDIHPTSNQRSKVEQTKIYIGDSEEKEQSIAPLPHNHGHQSARYIGRSLVVHVSVCRAQATGRGGRMFIHRRQDHASHGSFYQAVVTPRRYHFAAPLSHLLCFCGNRALLQYSKHLRNLMIYRPLADTAV